MGYAGFLAAAAAGWGAALSTLVATDVRASRFGSIVGSAWLAGILAGIASSVFLLGAAVRFRLAALRQDSEGLRLPRRAAALGLGLGAVPVLGVVAAGVYIGSAGGMIPVSSMAFATFPALPFGAGSAWLALFWMRTRGTGAVPVGLAPPPGIVGGIRPVLATIAKLVAIGLALATAWWALALALFKLTVRW